MCDGLCVMSVVVGYSSLLVVVGIDSEYMWENIYPNGCVRIQQVSIQIEFIVSLCIDNHS